MFDYSYLIFKCSSCGKRVADRRLFTLEIQNKMQCSCGHLMDYIETTKFNNGQPENLKLYPQTGCDYYTPAQGEVAEFVIQGPNGQIVGTVPINRAFDSGDTITYSYEMTFSGGNLEEEWTEVEYGEVEGCEYSREYSSAANF